MVGGDGLMTPIPDIIHKLATDQEINEEECADIIEAVYEATVEQIEHMKFQEFTQPVYN